MVLEVLKVCNDSYAVPEKRSSGVSKTAPQTEQNAPQLAPGIPADMLQVRESIKPLQEVEHEVHRLDTLQKALYVGGVLPPLRRIGSLPCSLENDDKIRAGLLLTMAAANFPGDLREISRAGKEFADMLHGVMPSAKNYSGQHAMTMLDGTFLEPITKLHGLKWLDKVDDPIYNNAFGRFLQKNFHLSYDPNAVKQINIPGIEIGEKTIIQSRNVAAFNFKGNYMQRLLGKSLMRISNLSLIFGALLEAPALVKSVKDTEGTAVDKTKAFGKQLLKSTGYIALSSACIALAGAAVSTTAIGSLVAMGVGSAVGLMASNALNKQIDKVIKTDEEKQHYCPSNFA